MVNKLFNADTDIETKVWNLQGSKSHNNPYYYLVMAFGVTDIENQKWPR